VSRVPAPGSGPVVVITGASSGIGRATAQVLAREGCSLVLAARRAEVLDEAVGECARLGGQAIAVPVDVSDAVAMERLAEAAVARFGRIDAWHNNAGVLALSRIDDLPAAEACRVIEIDVLGAVNGSAAALRRFRRQGHGILINTGSMLGVVAEPYATAYVASKHAIRGLGEALRAELADAPGVRVCTVLPIAADTPIFRRAANHTGRELRAIPPTVDPYRVAVAVRSLLRNPRDEVVVGMFGRLLWAGEMAAPSLLERTIAAVGPWLQFRPGPAPDSSGNLFAPVRDGWAVRGGWQTVPRSLLAAASLLALGGWLVLARRGLAGRHRLLQASAGREPAHHGDLVPLRMADALRQQPHARVDGAGQRVVRHRDRPRMVPGHDRQEQGIEA
jgi:NADP-dependent 3-hydroxy acid dehydrogenase YdfG